MSQNPEETHVDFSDVAAESPEESVHAERLTTETVDPSTDEDDA